MKTIIPILSLLFLTSCDYFNSKINLQGVIMDTVANKPIANTAFLLHYEHNARQPQPATESFYTDTNGAFNVTCFSISGLPVSIAFDSTNQTIWNATIQNDYQNGLVIKTRKP